MKNVLITGGSRGIGAATAAKFKKEGYNAIITYFSNDKAAKAVAESTGAYAIKCDAASAEAFRNALDEIHARFGKVGILVNNAGVALEQKTVSDVTDEEYSRLFDVNVRGAFIAAREIIPDMLALGGGSIINVSSVWGIIGGSCEVAYSATKGAVISMTRALAAELAPSGIRVNAVAPGFIDTDMNAHLTPDERSAFCERVALGRVGTPDEVSKAIFFLATGDSSYITGTVLRVDGGMV